MKKITFALTLEFEDKISPDDLKEIATKVAGALKYEIDSGNGLAPKDKGTYTTKINVFSPVYNINETINFV